MGMRSPYLSPAEAVNGLIDEARISTVARSADWIATEYANESSPWCPIWPRHNGPILAAANTALATPSGFPPFL